MPSFRQRSSTSNILRNVTIDDSASSLVYSQGWTKSSSSNAFGGGFSTTSTVGDIVQFFLPANAVAIYYNGFKQTGGGVCGVCLDCDAKGSGNLQTIDSHSATDDIAPTTLFSKMDIDPNTTHSFSLVNFPDGNFGNKGTITVDSFIVTIQGEAADANLVPNSESTLMPLTDIATGSASITFIESSTASSSAAVSSSSSSSTSTSSAAGSSASHTFNEDTSSGKSGISKSPVAIAGISVVCLLIGCTIIYALMYFMRRRRRKRDAPFVQIQQYQLPPKEPFPMSSPPPLPMQMEQQWVAPVTVPAPAATVPAMGSTMSRGDFTAGVRSPVSPDLSSAGTVAYSAQDPFIDPQGRESPGLPAPMRVPASPVPRALTPGTLNASRGANIRSPPPAATRPETEYIENPFLAAEVEARTRALLVERGYNPHQQHQHHHQTHSLDRFDYSSEQERAQDLRPVSTMTTMTMRPLPMPNLHEAKRKNSWELL
ncbi:hypothetical protein SCHPADRAFT_999784 [Schizopora paradoxa]|uniref:Uncharacterized protein n=1 Tax=Schizopora paradoxa TaxID=27342 RepID=A0A0H2RZB6_9AGAM|nr:hypothetical protein SCHPADRAFT_999784 [Schizopora paradoxa]